MMKMSKAQRTAILRADDKGPMCRGGFGGCGTPSTLGVLHREGWARDGYVTLAGLIAAGVDMDAIHGEAIEANDAFDRLAAKLKQAMIEIGEAQREQATPAYRHFAEATRQAGSYRGGLDILHVEALKEDGDRNAREFDRVQRVYNASHLRGEGGRVYDSRKAHVMAWEEHIERAMMAHLAEADAASTAKMRDIDQARSMAIAEHEMRDDRRSGCEGGMWCRCDASTPCPGATDGYSGRFVREGTDMLKLDVEGELVAAQRRAHGMRDYELLNAYAAWSARTVGPPTDHEALPYFEVLCVYRAELLRRLRR